MDPALRLRQAWRALLVVSILCIGLAGALVISCLRARAQPGDRAERIDPRADDASVRKEAVAELISKEGGGWDTFPDPEVGRLLQPGTESRSIDGEKFVVSANGVGLREKEFAMPKPAGVVRVVLLGDSFVFGTGVAENDRLGAFLRGYLTSNAGDPKKRIECLHF